MKELSTKTVLTTESCYFCKILSLIDAWHGSEYSPEIICQKIPEYFVVIAYKLLTKYRTLTLFRMGGGGVKKSSVSSFSPVSSENVEISPKNFLTFSFNPFVILV